VAISVHEAVVRILGQRGRVVEQPPTGVRRHGG
jgi:hypothetical protein